jgi:hypothetical protein
MCYIFLIYYIDISGCLLQGGVALAMQPGVLSEQGRHSCGVLQCLVCLAEEATRPGRVAHQQHRGVKLCAQMACCWQAPASMFTKEAITPYVCTARVSAMRCYRALSIMRATADAPSTKQAPSAAVVGSKII